jgi:serine/threonine-protein kinase
MGRVAEGTLLRDTYLIERLLGTGGMGEVYEATHRRLSGRYAIKVLLREMASQPGAFARFRREAELTSSLRHPNIVQVIDFNLMDDGAPYLVMEYLDGVDLATRLEPGPMSPSAALPLIKQIASALGAAHARGIVHRDLKPQNIFLVRIEGGDHEEIAKVLDFGISKMKSAAKSVTQDATVLGTPQYMSPEQALGQIDEIDHTTDQFALGAIAYEMLTGRAAFAGDDSLSVMYQVVNGEPAPLLGANAGRGAAALQAVLFKALAKKKSDRYSSVTDFARALAAAAVDDEPLVRGRVEPSPTPAPTMAFGYPLPSPSVERVTGGPSIEPVAGEPPRRTPTTFRTAVGELSARPRRSRTTVAAAGGALAVVGLVGLLSLRGRPAPPRVRPVAARPTVAPAAPPRAPALPSVEIPASPAAAELPPAELPQEQAALPPALDLVAPPDGPHRRGSRGSRGAGARRERAGEHERPAPPPAPAVVNVAPPPPPPPKPPSDLVKGDDL